MAAMAPELWPMMMVFSSQCSSVSMKGSQMLSRAVTKFQGKEKVSFDKDSLSLMPPHLSNRGLLSISQLKDCSTTREMGLFQQSQQFMCCCLKDSSPQFCYRYIRINIDFIFYLVLIRKYQGNNKNIILKPLCKLSNLRNNSRQQSQVHMYNYSFFPKRKFLTQVMGIVRTKVQCYSLKYLDLIQVLQSFIISLSHMKHSYILPGNIC